ncbi:hypothetical protein [Desulfobacter postgatei]|jgi:hypothetical protein|uniref:hypothetical protein n=1 Tax=Desulfobacter postgatei TaxID=2293 RepID=UPI002A35C433|nr:hypothetical protein [Desulfobacter postgatei]MDX9962518.1 hypothetical protein [Desulfobacter postgatei]
MATKTGANLLDSILQSTGVTLNPLLTATLTAKLQQMIDAGTYSNLAVSIAVSGFSTDINAATDVPELSDTVATNVALIEAADEGEVISFPPYGGSAPQVFTLTPDAAAINEGSTLTFTVTAANPVTEDTVVTFDVIPTFLEGSASTDITDSNAGTTGTNLNDFATGSLTRTATIAAGTTTATFTVTPNNDCITELSEGFFVKATVNGQELMVDATLLDGAAAGIPLTLTPSDDGSTMRLTGAQDVRIDFTDPSNQITGLDLDFDGTIEADGVENAVDVMPAADFTIVDAYVRNPLNHNDSINNFLGDIAFDGTGFDGDGVSTNGNIFLGGLGADSAAGGIGNDFMAGGGVAETNTGEDYMFGGRNADFFFVSLSALDFSDGDALDIDGGETADDSAAGMSESTQDTDWLLIEASDDDEPVEINLGSASEAGTIRTEFREDDNGNIDESDANDGIDLINVENVDASGNLYGFLDDVDVAIGENGMVVDGENVGIGATAQLIIRGNASVNRLIGGFDNDWITGNAGNDLLMGGNLDYNNNPNTQNIVDNGMDVMFGDAGDDDIVFEADGGVIEGGTTENDDDDAGVDTLWLTDMSLGTQSVEEMTTDNTLRFDLLVGKEGGLDNAAGYGGADEDYRDGDYTADQTNYADGVDRVQVQNMENVIATGLGAIDFLAAGTNDPELVFNNQQNFYGYEGDLALYGTDADNILYASTGDDVIEGREGDDLMSGGAGNDDFVFALGSITNTGSLRVSQDGVDVIHRQVDADGDNLWDTDEDGEVIYGQDFGLDSTETTYDSSFTLGLPSTLAPYVDGIKFELDGTEYTVNGLTADNTALWLINLQAALKEIPGLEENRLTASSESDGVVTILDRDGGEFEELADGWLLTSGSLPSDGVDQWYQEVGGPVVEQEQDRLIYTAYEDRDDGELRDDDSIVGSNVSLGIEGYAEDLVINFADDGTRIAEDQAYELTFDNLTTEDIVTITVNGVTYELQVGIDLDGNIIANEDGPFDDQANIQTVFLRRLTNFINNFMDDDTAAGQVSAALNGSTITLTQANYNGEETVFMVEPDVEIQNLSGGEKATVEVENVSDHEVLLLDFDGRDGELNSENVLFIGNTGISRATLETAVNEGGTIYGDEAILIDNGADTHADEVANTGQMIWDSQATNSWLDRLTDIYAVHGDDLLIGGTGDDEIYGGTGDDRVIGSLGDDTLDGGKNFYEVQVLGEATTRVYELNNWESLNPDEVDELDGLTITSITLIPQAETGVTLDDGRFDDTLLFQQADFTPGETEFTITLNDYEMNDGVVELQNDGAGTVDVDVDGDGVFESSTTFTNFENVRTVSGIGNAVAGDGQGNDTLNVSAMSTDTGGISYDLTNEDTAGVVAYSADSAINVKALEAGQDAADLPGATLASVRAAILGEQSNTPFNAAVAAIPLAVDGNPISIAAFLAEVAALPELTRPTSVIDDLTGAEPNPDFSDYETTVIRVDGVENVIGGDGNDLLLIDETEAAKDNLFDAGLGSDRIEYQNDYNATLVAEPTVTIKVNTAADTDEVVMTGGRVGDTVATDTLNDVEYITLAGDTAQSTRADDVIDVTAMATGAVVDYVEEEVRDLDGDVQVVIENMFEMENVWADGDDTVIVADNDTMSNNAQYSGDDADILFATFMDYDQLDDDTNMRIAFADQTSTQIQDVENLGLFTFDLSKTGDGNDSDTADYSQAVDSIATTVMRGAQQYVLVDGDDDIADTFGNNWVDRVDSLIGVERIVASQAESVLDFTSMGEDVQISFQFDDNNADAATDTMENVVRIGDANGNTIEGIPNYIERFDLDDDDDVPAFNTAAWTRIEGGDYAEAVFYDGSEDIANLGGVDHRYTSDALNLRGGDNNVSYYALETSIEAVIEITEFDADNALTTGLTTVTVDFEDGTGTQTLLPDAGTHTITSYTSDNGIAAGSLKLEASQDAEDSLRFEGDATKLYILGTSPGVIDVGINEFADIDVMRLTGFEILLDGASDDAYDMQALGSVLGNLTLDDNAADDHDAIQVYDDAVGYGAAPADTIDLDALNTEFKFDFDVLDVTGVTENGLTLNGAVDGGGFALEPNPDEDTTNEVVVGSLALIDTITNFASVVLTEDTVAAGTSFILDLDAGVLSQGSIDVDFDGNVLSAGGLFFEGTYLNSYLNPLETGVTITLVDDAATGATLVGGDGDDEITGAAGDDQIYGGLGADTLDGAFVAVVPEVHTFTLTGTVLDATNNFSLTFGDTTIVTINEGDEIPTGGADVDQIGAALAAFDWSAATFDHDGDSGALTVEVAGDDLFTVTYDSATNVVSFTFDEAYGDVSDIVLDFTAINDVAATVSIEGVPANALAGSEPSAIVDTAYAAQVESSDTFVYLTAAESTEISMDQISNFTIDGNGGAVNDKLDISAIMDEMGADGSAAFNILFSWNNTGAVTFETLKAEADDAFALGFVGYAGSTGEDAEGNSYVFLDANENGEYDAADGVVELTGIAHNDFVGTGFGSDNLILV